MNEYSFKFSPSLLQSFQDYLDSDILYEKFYGQSETMTCEEYEKQKFGELIDRINRVPFKSEATSKGSCLNEIADCIIMGVPSTRDDIVVSTVRSAEDLYALRWMKNNDGSASQPSDVKENFEKCKEDFERIGMSSFIYSSHEGYEFLFDTQFCKRAASYFEGSLCQVYTEAPIETRYGTVLLYGYPDYIRGDKVYDMKTTSKYEFGKYGKYWQRIVYPYTLIESGKCTDIRSFEFTAFQMMGGSQRSPLISGERYPEVYVYSHNHEKARLRCICEQFAEFLINNKSLITDKKIFGGEKLTA